MKIDCYLSPHYSSEEDLRKNITFALFSEKVQAEVNFHRINDDNAMSLGLKGSPSVFIDGMELQPLRTTGFSWRLFIDESGRLANTPSVVTIRVAIREALLVFSPQINHDKNNSTWAPWNTSIFKLYLPFRCTTCRRKIRCYPTLIRIDRSTALTTKSVSNAVFLFIPTFGSFSSMFSIWFSAPPGAAEVLIYSTHMRQHQIS